MKSIVVRLIDKDNVVVTSFVSDGDATDALIGFIDYYYNNYHLKYDSKPFQVGDTITIDEIESEEEEEM